MRNQPNHPEVSPLFTANPIADVSLSVLPFSLSPPCCLSLIRSLVFSLSLSLPLSLSLFLSLGNENPQPASPCLFRSFHSRSVPVPTTVCLFAAALANPNRGWSVFALNLPLRETVPLESNKTRNRARIRVIFSLGCVPPRLASPRRAKFANFRRAIPIDISSVGWTFHLDRLAIVGGWMKTRARRASVFDYGYSRSLEVRIRSRLQFAREEHVDRARSNARTIRTDYRCTETTGSFVNDTSWRVRFFDHVR